MAFWDPPSGSKNQLTYVRFTRCEQRQSGCFETQCNDGLRQITLLELSFYVDLFIYYLIIHKAQHKMKRETDIHNRETERKTRWENTALSLTTDTLHSSDCLISIK